MKIAYFVNQYPKVSHSFIRREFVALETLGFPIERLALRGWDDDFADHEDLAERGRTGYVLGQGLLPVILAFLRESECGHQFELVLAGNGEMRPAIEAAMARYALSDKVRITGWISSEQVQAELMGARAMMLPSIEAMALRRPVLTTYVAGIPELVKDGRTSWLMPAGSVEALADSMVKCLAMDADQLQVRGDAARERVLQRHDIRTEAAKLARYFRDAG